MSYETTIPVHTTRDRFGVAFETATGMTVGEDFYLCHSPGASSAGVSSRTCLPEAGRRVDPSRLVERSPFYESALEFDERPTLQAQRVWDLGSAEAAELAKLAETTYRDVNIGLANQFARLEIRSALT